jgi:hypothetical protein
MLGEKGEGENSDRTVYNLLNSNRKYFQEKKSLGQDGRQ